MDSPKPDEELHSSYDTAATEHVGTESFLRLLVDNTSDGLLAIDASSTIVFANPAIEHIFGYRPEDVVGESLTVLIPERLRQSHFDALERYLETGERRLDWDSAELPGLHRDGHEVPLEISFREVEHDGQHLFIGVISDVTDRTHAESERRLLYSVSRAVAEAGSFEDGLQAAVEQVCNLTEWEYGEGWVPTGEGRLERTSARYATAEALVPFQEVSSVTEFPSGEGLPGRVWSTKEPEWMSDVSAVSREVFPRTDVADTVDLKAALGVPIVFEDEVVAVLAFYMREHRETDERLVETIGAVASELGDLVARRRAEDRLERERALLERVLETGPVGIYIVDSRGEMERMNSRAEALLGVDGADLEGHPYAGVNSVEDETGAPVLEEALPAARVLATGEAVEGFEHRVERADGTHRWLSSNAAPFTDDGRVTRVVVTLSDVTEHRAYERRLERERDELESELNDVLGRITDAFFAVDEAWRFTYLNDRAADPLDASRRDLLGTSIWEGLPELVGTTFEEQYRRAVETQEPVTFEAESIVQPGTWLEVRAFPSESGLSVYFRDVTKRKRHERTLTALHGATRDLFTAESERAVAERMVDTATDVIDLSGVMVYLYDAAESRLRPVATSEALEELVEDSPSLAPGEGVVGRVFLEGEPAHYDDVREAGDVYNPDTQLRSELVVPLGEHGVLVASSTDVGVFDERTRELSGVLGTAGAAALDALERDQQLRERERELAEQNRRLTQLSRINDIIRRIDSALVDATTREEIDAAVCELLADAEQFAFAWIGDVTDGAVTPRAWAGDEGGYLDTAIAGGDASEGEPAVSTARSGEASVVADVAEALHAEGWRQEALVRGYQSAISVPLAYDDYVYGVLTVYAADSGAFEDEFLPVFRELGNTIANAIHAVETRQGFLFDRVVELDVRIDDPNAVLHRIAAATGGELEFEGVVPQSGAATPVFFTVTGAPPDRVRSVAEEFVDVERIRLVRAADDGGLFEALVTDSLVASAVVDYGGIPRSIHTDGAELRAAVDLPYSLDVRAFFEQLRSRYSTAELVAQRVRERPVETRQGFLATLEDRLTDRQWEVLRTAYLSGFFEEPRSSTGEEIGRALGIAQPTFTSHLRAAQRTLFSLLLEELPAPSESSDGDS